MVERGEVECGGEDICEAEGEHEWDPACEGGVDRLVSICIYAGSNSNKGDERKDKMGGTKEE